MRTCEITVDRTSGFYPGDRVRLGDGRTFKVLATSSNAMKVRPWRWYDDRWARILAFWASLAAVLGWLAWLLIGALVLAGCSLGELAGPSPKSRNVMVTCGAGADSTWVDSAGVESTRLTCERPKEGDDPKPPRPIQEN